MKNKILLLGIGISSLIYLPSFYYLESFHDSIYIPGGFNRGIRCIYTASKITYRYLNVIIPWIKKGITDESHDYSAKLLSDCFKINAGCYIKLGQFISQVISLLIIARASYSGTICQAFRAFNGRKHSNWI